MQRNGNGKHPTPLLANLTVPGAAFADGDYAAIRLRLDCYDDFIVAQKYDKGVGKGFYALDPLDVAAALAGLTIGTPLLPPGCLFWQRADGGERLGIYAPPNVWTVHVSAGEKRETLAVPMPGLVWIGRGTGYSLFAVKGAEWPGPDTQLWKAPCPNLGDQGICRGNVEFPAAGAGTIWPALRLFFESDFNDHLSNGKSKKYPKSVLGMWRALAEADGVHPELVEGWPEEDLVSAETTLGKVVGK